jgi:hypothetical protein
MKLIQKTIQIISIIVLSMGFLGCQEDEKEFPTAFAEFTYTVNQETGVVKFINTSRNATIFTWSFGDQTSSTEVNPSHIYQPGTYLVSLVAKNIAGSFRTYQDTIIIGGDNNNGGGGSADCTAEASENIDPANGDLNWTFKTNDSAHTFEAFGNTAGSIVDNPVVDDVNSSCYVEQFVKASGCETWSGLGNELATAIDFTSSSTNKVFKMKVLAKNQSADVTLRLERLPYPDTDPAVERVASVTTVGAWQELTFDFSDVTTGTYKSMILYFERNASCDGDIYYFDDIMQVESTGGGGGITDCTAEASENIDPANGDLNWTFKTNDVNHTFEAFGNTAGSIVDNPVLDAVNSSCNVEQFVKASGCETWSGLGFALATAIDFTSATTNKAFTMKVLAENQIADVTLRLERLPYPDTDPAIERVASITQVGAWQELTFDFSDVSTGTYKSMILYFERNASCDGDIYYFDDIIQVAGTGGSGGGGTGGTGGGCTGTAVAATAFPVNFETCESFISTFTDGGSITTTLDDNPSKAGINTSDFVLRVDKASGTNRWAGFQNPFPSNFDATKTFKVKIYSTRANVVMRFEVNSDPQPNSSGNPGPQFATIVNANTWTEVQIVFTGIPANNTGLNQFVIKPDNPDGTDGTTTSGDATYYFDDIRLE